MHVVATTFTMYLLLLLISHVISCLLTVETGKWKKEGNFCYECHGVAGLSETEPKEFHSHTRD